MADSMVDQKVVAMVEQRAGTKVGLLAEYLV
jgi:hypothetical protein